MKILGEVVILSFLVIIGWRSRSWIIWRRLFRRKKQRSGASFRSLRHCACGAAEATPAPATPRDMSWTWQPRALDAPSR